MNCILFDYFDNNNDIFYSAVLITGGDYGRSVEIYLPSGNTSCSLMPELPVGRDRHTQDGPWACGGWDGFGQFMN